MTGSDICGFYGTADEILCGRWIQLGALYPFARNHNHKDWPDQEFHRYTDKLITAAKTSLQSRYSLLRHFYSLFLKSVNFYKLS